MKRPSRTARLLTAPVNPGRNPHTVAIRGRAVGFLSWYSRPAVPVVCWLALALLLGGCAQGSGEIAPPEIHYGEDLCEECDMIISDARFAAAYVHEIAAGRYEQIAFDDIGEMIAHAAGQPQQTIVAWYVHDYASEEWIDATDATFVVSEQIRSPMASGVAAHNLHDAAQAMAGEVGGEVLDWSALRARFQDGLVSAGGVATMGHNRPSQNSGGTASGSGQIVALDTENGRTIRLTLVSPISPSVGRQKYEIFAVEARAGEEERPAAGLALSLVPDMPAMGHGSTGNEDPADQGDGHYVGQVNFSMAGRWAVTVVVSEDGTELGQVVFEHDIP